MAGFTRFNTEGFRLPAAKQVNHVNPESMPNHGVSMIFLFPQERRTKLPGGRQGSNCHYCKASYAAPTIWNALAASGLVHLSG
jgi:hypothetical protein